MNNEHRQEEYEKAVIQVIKKTMTLEEILNTTANSGWCHFNKELNFLTQEVIGLKEEVRKLKRIKKKVIDDE